MATAVAANVIRTAARGNSQTVSVVFESPPTGKASFLLKACGLHSGGR